MNRARMRGVMAAAGCAAAMLASGCAADLPEGWEGAVRVDDLVQMECSGDPYGTFDERFELAPASGALAVDYLEAHFRCEQDVVAFALVDADAVDLLVQPDDMNPNVVAACDCLYDISFSVDDLAPGDTTVSLYRRWDNLNEPNEPVLIGSTGATIP